MLLLLLCVVINALIGIIFKYFNKYNVEAFPAIVINYFVCVVTGSLMLGEVPFGTDIIDKPWFLYALVLSCMFIGTFTIMAYTVRGFGIVIATIFQKMSLLAPTIIGIAVYHEGNSAIKTTGIILAVASIFVITRSDKETATNDHYRLWIYPLIVFLGSCIIDFILFYVNINNIVDSGDIRFVIALFLCAGIIGFIVLSIQIALGKSRLTVKSLFAGIALGIPNFFSIYLLVQVLSKGMDASVVFPINNVGILAISAMLGIILFKEKIGFTKLGGLALAIGAILLIANG